MSINDVTDWSPWYSYLDPSARLQPDIVLNVRERVTRNDGTVQVSDYFMDGHKVLLAAANPVFRSHFYGPEAVKGDTLLIEETTFDAFLVLYKFIYEVPDYLSPTDNLQKLFDIRHIAERYQAIRLVEEVNERITLESDEVNERVSVIMDEMIAEVPIEGGQENGQRNKDDETDRNANQDKPDEISKEMENWGKKMNVNQLTKQLIEKILSDKSINFSGSALAAIAESASAYSVQVFEDLVLGYLSRRGCMKLGLPPSKAIQMEMPEVVGEKKSAGSETQSKSIGIEKEQALEGTTTSTNTTKKRSKSKRVELTADKIVKTTVKRLRNGNGGNKFQGKKNKSKRKRSNFKGVDDIGKETVKRFKSLTPGSKVLGKSNEAKAVTKGDKDCVIFFLKTKIKENEWRMCDVKVVKLKIPWKVRVKNRKVSHTLSNGKVKKMEIEQEITFY